MQARLESIVIAIVVFYFTSISVSQDINPAREVFVQLSTIDALLNGLYDGLESFDNLEPYGDFGLGTFENLDGELVQLDDIIYQIKSDGKVHKVTGDMRTPFINTTFFEADQTFEISDVTNLETFKDSVDKMLPSVNLIYAIKLEGNFEYMKTRSIPAQKKPYPTLSQAAANQSIFEFNNINGTLVGFRCPEFVKGLNVPGYHLHFISADQSSGGHVLEFSLSNGKATIDFTDNYRVILPSTNTGFLNMDLSEDKTKELGDIENK